MIIFVQVAWNDIADWQQLFCTKLTEMSEIITQIDTIKTIESDLVDGVFFLKY